MKSNYQHLFEFREDKVRVSAFAVHSRYSRLGLPDSLSIKIPSGFPWEVGENEEEDGDPFNKPHYRGFTSYDLASIQLGELVRLQSGGLTRRQLSLLKSLSEFYIGASVLDDYSLAMGEVVRTKTPKYPIKDIREVVKNYEFFTDSFNQKLEDIDFSLGMISFLIGDHIPSKADDNHKKPKLKVERLSFKEIEVLMSRTLRKIDKSLMSKL